MHDRVMRLIRYLVIEPTAMTICIRAAVHVRVAILVVRIQYAGRLGSVGLAAAAARRERASAFRSAVGAPAGAPRRGRFVLGGGFVDGPCQWIWHLGRVPYGVAPVTEAALMYICVVVMHLRDTR